MERDLRFVTLHPQAMLALSSLSVCCRAIVLAALHAGGLLGLGGGMIIGPVLLEMGVHPQASATTVWTCAHQDAISVWCAVQQPRLWRSLNDAHSMYLYWAVHTMNCSVMPRTPWVARHPCGPCPVHTPPASQTLPHLPHFPHLPRLQVSSATSSTMVLFSSSTALISLAALGMLNPPYAAAFSVASMVASVLGVMVIGG